MCLQGEEGVGRAMQSILCCWGVAGLSVFLCVSLGVEEDRYIGFDLHGHCCLLSFQ
jgi:hypothetical protein